MTKEPQERQEKAVLVPCEFARASVPTELIFWVETAGGTLRGVAPVEYCFDADRMRLKSEMIKPGDRVKGYIVGVTVGGKTPPGAVRVHLPDGYIYDIPEENILSGKELAHVSLQS